MSQVLIVRDFEESHDLRLPELVESLRLKDFRVQVVDDTATADLLADLAEHLAAGSVREAQKRADAHERIEAGYRALRDLSPSCAKCGAAHDEIRNGRRVVLVGPDAAGTYTCEACR